MKLKMKTKTEKVEKITPKSTIETVDIDLAGMTTKELVARAGTLQEREEKLNAQLMEDPRFQELKAHQTAMNETLKLLKERMSQDLDGEKGKIEKGGPFAAELSPCRKNRTVNDKLAVAGALDAIQEGLAIELAQFKITDLDKHLTGALQDQFIETNFNGPRTLKVERVG